jgi:hypothetical protein
MRVLLKTKKIEKLLCRTGGIWLADKEAILKVLEGKPEYERMKRDMENDEVFLQFSSNKTMHTGEPRRVKKTEWSVSADGKEVYFKGAVLTIQELTAKKFVFLIDRKSDLPLTFILPTKKQQEIILQRIKEADSQPEEKPKKAEMPEEKKE